MEPPIRRHLVLATLLGLSACGQSGPLYIPGDPSQVQDPPPVQEPQDNDDEKPENDR